MLDRLRAGDEDAFDTLFREHYAELVRFAAGLLGDRDAAEEVVQDVMVELWRRRRRLAIDAPIRAYLRRAVRNRALNRIRHDRIARAAAPRIAQAHAPTRAADARTLEGELQLALVEALAELPPRCREVFELSRIDGLRYADIASRLGISIKTVEARMGRTLRILRERLAPWLRDTSM